MVIIDMYCPTVRLVYCVVQRVDSLNIVKLIDRFVHGWTPCAHRLNETWKIYCQYEKHFPQSRTHSTGVLQDRHSLGKKNGHT